MKTIIFFIVLFFLVINVYAQEIGISPTKVWTNNYEIENPVGFSVHLSQPIGRIVVKAEYVSSVKNERSYYGFLYCGFIVDPVNQVQEPLTSNSSFSSVEFSLLIPELINVLQNQLNIGAGFSVDKFSRDKIGLSSGRSFKTDENKFGLFYSVSLSRQDVLGLPVKLGILFKHKALMEGNFATDAEQPFTGAMDIKELQFNFTYIF